MVAMAEDIDAEWYWDRRTRKALSPRRIGEDTVAFVTVWHRDEVDDAMEHGALVPIEEVGLDRTETTLDLIDSFRLQPDLQGEAPAEGEQERSGEGD